MLTEAAWMQAVRLAYYILSNSSRESKTTFYLSVLNQTPEAFFLGVTMAQQSAARQAFLGTWGAPEVQA